jgi:protein O-GlcNAc transferase
MVNDPFNRSRQSVSEIFQRDLEATKRLSLQVRDGAVAKWRQALKTSRPDPITCLEAARCQRKLGEYRECIAILEQGLQYCAPSVPLYRWYINALQECNLTREAIASAQSAALLFPDNLSVKMVEALALPVLYDSEEELEHYRHRFTEGLHRLNDEVRLDTPESRHRALSAVGNHANTLLAYQGRNDRELQEGYGNFIHRIMAANYPKWARHLRMPTASTEGKLRVGYVSSRFRNLSAMKYFLGWLREHNKGRFAIYSYHVGKNVDSVTKEVQRISEGFQHLPNALEDACRAILADNLQILVFLDIGLDPVMSQLAALRLAPIQCMAWDQPVTSGLPTVDYFLSSALAEPENAQDHYSEALVLLPEVGVCYPRPLIPALLLEGTRKDFHIREDAVVYLCCQEAKKFLPEQDALFAQIARRVPNSQFVFLVKNALVGNDFRKRLDLAFSSFGLQVDDHCVLLSELDRFRYLSLQSLGDVFLDAMGWSGGVSTFEAVACRLPIVTMPGMLMRSRQSYAILTQLGVTDTIARDKSDYVDIAVRLGLNRQWREEISQRMVSRYSSLYSDRRCVGALEEFFERTVEERRQTPMTGLFHV